MIEIDLPDGTIAEFPEGTPPEVIKAALRKKFPKPSGSAPPAEPEQPAAAAPPAAAAAEADYDLPKSIGQGAVEGIAGIAGLPASIEQLTGQGARWALNKVWPESPQQAAMADELERRPSLGSYTDPAAMMGYAQQAGVPSHEPQTTLGKFGRSVGQMLPTAFLGPGGAAAKISAALGGGIGAEAAAMQTEGTALEPYAPYARVAGGALGAIGGGGLGSAAGRLAMPPIPGQTKTTSMLLKRSMPQNPAQFANLGDDAMLMDASPSMTGLGQGLAIAPGEQKNLIADALAGRHGGRSDRLMQDTRQTLGRLRDPERLSAVLGKAATRQSAPIYKQAFQNAPQLPSSLSNTLAAQLTGPAVGLNRSARGGMGVIMDDIDDALLAGSPEETARRLMHVRQSLDHAIDYKGQGPPPTSYPGTTQKMLKDARSTVDDVLKNRIPGIDQADAIVHKSKVRQRSIDYGFDALDGGKTAKMPESFRFDLRKLDKPFVGEGAKSRIANAMGTQSNDLAALKKMIGGDHDFNRAKLEQLFGPRKVEKLVQAVDREETFGKTFANVLENSQTAHRTEAAKSIQAAEPIAFKGNESVLGLGGKVVEKVGNAIAGKIITKSSQPTRDALTKALLTKGPEARALLALIAQQQVGGGISAAFARALLGGLASKQQQQRP